MNSTPNAMQPMQQQQQQQQQQSTQQYNQTQETMNAMQQQPPQQHMQQQQQQHVPQASPHNTMTAPSPAASVASNVHPPSIPSQSPHSNHNMTSPHPQPSPHQTSPHPMTISPAAHSPYQAQQQQPQPQPSPQPSPLGQARQPERSPHLQYQQHSHHQMQHLQHMSRFYHPNAYPNYAAAAAMSTTRPHHLGRLQAAGMPP